MSQFRRFARDQVGEEFPDCVARGRTSGDEVIYFYDFVQGMHFVQWKRQFRIVRNVAVCESGFGQINFGEAVAQV